MMSTRHTETGDRAETNRELPLKERFTIYEEGPWWISTHMKPESEECYQIAYRNILYT